LDVKTIAPDGTRESVLVATTYKGSNYKIASQPTWSVDSKFVAYEYLVSNNGGDKMDVYIVDRNGSQRTNLTSDVDANAIPTAWR
jgi:Tol biopolymer transport system component